MKFTSILSAAALAGYTFAVDVACLVNGESVAVVDSETGVCPFTVPEQFPVSFNFVSSEEYDVTFYYAVAQSIKYFTDIVNEGREIAIPAISLFGFGPTPLFQVSLEETPAVNSTAAIRRRLLRQVEIVKRAEIDDFIAEARTEDGTQIDGVVFEVVLASEVGTGSGASSTGAGAGAGAGGVVTETNTDTTLLTITTCSNNACGATEVTGVATLTTETVEGTVTSYTTYCPAATTVVTITSCSDDACATEAVPATASLTTVTVEGTVTSYYTYCPITGETVAPGATTAPGAPGAEGAETVTAVETTVITVTSCKGDVCAETAVPATPAEATTTDEAGVESTYTTYVEVTSTVGPAPAPGPEGETTTGTVAAETTTGTAAPGAPGAPTGAAGEAGEATTEAGAAPTAAPTVAGVSTTLGTSVAAASSAITVPGFEGAGAKYAASGLAVIAPLVALLF